jgi:hypothetical protein
LQPEGRDEREKGTQQERKSERVCRASLDATTMVVRVIFVATAALLLLLVHGS